MAVVTSGDLLRTQTYTLTVSRAAGAGTLVTNETSTFSFKSHQRKKLERLCRYIARPAIAEQRAVAGEQRQCDCCLKDIL